MCGDYPLGAEFDSCAPWNEETADYNVKIEYYDVNKDSVVTEELTVTIVVDEYDDDTHYKICEEVKNYYDDFDIVDYERA